MTKKPKPPRDSKAEPAKPEPKPRRNYMVALSAEVPAIARQALGSKGYAEAGLFTHWAEIAGAQLAASSLPIKLSFPRGKRDEGTLTVRCGGAAVRARGRRRGSWSAASRRASATRARRSRPSTGST